MVKIPWALNGNSPRASAWLNTLLFQGFFFQVPCLLFFGGVFFPLYTLHFSWFQDLVIWLYVIIITSYHVHHDYRIVITTYDSSSFDLFLAWHEPPVISVPCPKGASALAFNLAKAAPKTLLLAGSLEPLSDSASNDNSTHTQFVNIFWKHGKSITSFFSHGTAGFSIGFSVASGLAASKTHFSMQGMRMEWMCYAKMNKSKCDMLKRRVATIGCKFSGRIASWPHSKTPAKVPKAD